MFTSLRRGVVAFFAIFFSFFVSLSIVPAQSAGNSGTVYGTVTDPTGAVIRGAVVNIQNPVSGLTRSTTSDSSGHFQFTNLPLNPYHLSISAPGFSNSVPSFRSTSRPNCSPVAQSPR
jgi:hypothetical protein